ncbi:Hypothetical predicted protein, partial [Podarcis lilfordi]
MGIVMGMSWGFSQSLECLLLAHSVAMLEQLEGKCTACMQSACAACPLTFSQTMGHSEWCVPPGSSMGMDRWSSCCSSTVS